MRTLSNGVKKMKKHTPHFAQIFSFADDSTAPDATTAVFHEGKGEEKHHLHKNGI